MLCQIKTQILKACRSIPVAVYATIFILSLFLIGNYCGQKEIEIEEYNTVNTMVSENPELNKIVEKCLEDEKITKNEFFRIKEEKKFLHKLLR